MVTTSLVNSVNQIFYRVCSNQRLKLTEPAVDDYGARQYAENDMISRYVRATGYIEVAVRRRSLAAIR